MKNGLATLFAFLSLAVCSLADPVDQEQLQWTEDLSESLANQLHELSLAVRDRDIDRLAAHFAVDLNTTGLPQGTGEHFQKHRWIRQVATRPGAPGLDRAAFIASWKTYLAHFSSIEDVRFKLKQAHFQSAAPIVADAHFYFFVVGRNLQKGREWVEARGHLQAHLAADSTWQIDAFAISEFDARLVEEDLFSEISRPTGVHRAVPPFGSAGNQGFAAHGVAVHDVDQDGLLDALVTGINENYLYLNQGDGTFADRAAEVGIRFTPSASGPLFLDWDNDGDSDLFLASAGMQMLFENRLVPDGRLEFIDVSLEAGINHPAHGYSAISADVNQDGLPDIYVASYNRYGLIMPNSWSRATNGTPNLLFINQGNGRFSEEAVAWGVADSRWSYAAQFGDLDADGLQDLYVANDFGENALYINEGDRFRDVAAERGALDPGNGMGVSFGDYDNDGLLDIYVTNMSSTAGNRILRRLFPDEASQLSQTRVLNKLAAGNALLRNMGDGTFADVSTDLGPFSAGWAFGGGFIDFDNDGWEDLHAPNGFISGKSLKDT